MALSAIPERFRSELGNFAVLLDDWGDGSRHMRENMRPEDAECGLLGLYEGVPGVEYSGDPTGMLPCTITLFMDLIAEEARETGDELSLVVRETLWHEFAHALGFDEDGAERLERRWEERWQEKYG